MQRLLELFERGGGVMYVIALSSVVALAIFLERAWALRRSRVVPRALIVEVTELLRQGKRAEAIARCAGSHTPAGAIFEAVLRKVGAPADELKTAAQDVGRREAQRLERFAVGIGTVASLGPLLGLLGTVLGMIAVFQKVAEVGAGSPLEMAEGIWQALLTTAFGLLVGIPALVMHRFILSRVDARVLELEEEAVALVDLLEDEDGVPPASPRSEPA